MLTVGESVYKTCERQRLEFGTRVPCYGQVGRKYADWCRSCLLAEIGRLKDALRRVGATAIAEAER